MPNFLMGPFDTPILLESRSFVSVSTWLYVWPCVDQLITVWVAVKFTRFALYLQQTFANRKSPKTGGYKLHTLSTSTAIETLELFKTCFIGVKLYASSRIKFHLLHHCIPQLCDPLADIEWNLTTQYFWPIYGDMQHKGEFRVEKRAKESNYSGETRPWWIICGASFLVQFFVFGQQNCAGIVYATLIEEYKSSRGATGINVIVINRKIF